MAVKFNLESSVNTIWFNLTYQSNDILNDALTETLHTEIKVLIAENLFEVCKIKGGKIVKMESHVHGNLIFEVQPNRFITVGTLLDVFVSVLKLKLIPHTPKLLFNVSIVGVNKTDAPRTNFMYVEGSETMNDNFQEKISHLF